jgi:hypothetical protein
MTATMTATRPTDSGAFRPAPTPRRCPACGGAVGTLLTRFLCPSCYQTGEIRSCFDHRGRRVSEQPVPYTETNTYTTPPIVPTTGLFAGQPQPPQPPRPRRTHRRRRTSALAGELDRAARDEQDDAALLAAVDQLTAEGRYPEIEGSGFAAGAYAASERADLTDRRARQAVERLVSAGKIAPTTVRVLRRLDGGDKNQTAAGLKRVEGAA